MDGVLETIVGYTGGTAYPNEPSYEAIGDFVEALLVVFDETVIEYEVLLEKWAARDAVYAESFLRQYQSGVFYATRAQKGVAEKVFESLKEGRTVHAELAKLGPFHRAEEYHQHYLRKEQRS